jgi:hypothetical protein
LDAKTIADYALSKDLVLWQAPNAELVQLRQLTRERTSLIRMRVQSQNQQESRDHSRHAVASSSARNQALRNCLNAQIKAIEGEITVLVGATSALSTKMKLLQTIPGVGQITAWTVVGETLGFTVCMNAASLTSYAGLDVRFRESGKYKGKSKLSKQGNEYLRTALYMSSLSALRNKETPLGMFYDRLVSKGKLGKVAQLAVARKLLCLMYSIWQSATEFDACFEAKRRQSKDESVVEAVVETLAAPTASLSNMLPIVEPNIVLETAAIPVADLSKSLVEDTVPMTQPLAFLRPDVLLVRNENGDGASTSPYEISLTNEVSP